ncbi:MAG: CvpA family protein [Bacteroidales bacterium]|jgi:membrane protein required for colicin V production|nr:CvpA family protein [Bacteroidales bacterium]HOL98850.1 CvpA family protein [Bacteroidales bacterium]HOM37050.1 CvpA family protein [Bacteroidales bacterium]HPD24675.1 CvpA family protein [Bacteroidales bacterium]HRT00420.1 CvpA family protein [Bacteroidales bacterium]
MGIFDIIICLVLVYSAYKGFKNGLVKELAINFALIAGVFIAVRFSDMMASLLSNSGKIAKEYIPLVSFVVVFVAVIILIYVFAHVFDKLMNKIKLQWLNKTGGVVFALLKISIIIGGLFFIFKSFNNRLEIIAPEKLNNSIIFKFLLRVFEYIFPYAKNLKDIVHF